MSNGTEQEVYAPDVAIGVYLDAKYDVAERELDKARRFYNEEANPYTHERLKWCEHQLAVIKGLQRDVPNWKTVLQNYRRRIEKRRYKT